MPILKKKPVLESAIEKPVVAYAKKKYAGRILVRKMNGLGYRAWCDRLFVGPWSRSLWIEFKRPGEVATPLQLEHHRQLEALGHVVYVVDDVKVGKALVDDLFVPPSAADGTPWDTESVAYNRERR